MAYIVYILFDCIDNMVYKINYCSTLYGGNGNLERFH